METLSLRAQWRAIGRGDLVAAVCSGGCRVWSLRTGQLLRILGGDMLPVAPAALCDDGATVVLAGRDDLLIADVLGRRERTHSVAETPSAFTLSRSGSVAALGGEDGRITVLGVAEGAVRGMLGGLVGGHGAPVSAIAFSEDESLLVSGDDRARVCVWRLDDLGGKLRAARRRDVALPRRRTRHPCRVRRERLSRPDYLRGTAG